MDDELSDPKGKKSFWDNTAFVVVLVAVVVFLFLSLAFASIMYMIVNDMNRPQYNDEPRTLDISADIYGYENKLVIFVISGIIDWNYYQVQVNRSIYHFMILEQEGEDSISLAGDVVYFSDATWDPEISREYKVRIIDEFHNDEIWVDYIVAC